MTEKCRMKWLACLVMAISLTCAAARAGESPGSLTVVPDQIQIGTFYHGTRVRVSADSVACDGAVLVLEGNDEEVSLNRKGRVALIWMNVAQLTISGLPQVYILAASDKLDDICSKETQEKLRLGVESLRPRMKIHSDQPLTGKEFDQFLILKTRNGTYNTNDKIELSSISSNGRKLSADLPVPSGMPSGNYDIHLYCFREGNLVDERVARLSIDRIGLPHFMINLAYKHAAEYGLLAIIVAMAAGIVMGVIFSSLPGRGR